MKSWRIVWLLFIVVIVYNCLDSWQTVLLLSVGAYEANPLIAWTMNFTGSVHCVWLVKAAPLTLLGVALYKQQLKEENKNVN